MLQGFMDDSGSDATRAPFVLGGFVMEAEKWADFSDDWYAQVIRQPRIEYFHMIEACSKDRQFEGFSDEFVRCKINDLLGVIEKYQPDGIYTWLEWEDYISIVQPLAPKEMSNPYQVLFPGIFDTIRFCQRRKGIFPQSVDVDFDSQGEAGEFARSMYPIMKAHCPPDVKKMLGRTPTMLDDKEVVALQAADMLAWNVRRHYDKTDTTKAWEWLYERLERQVCYGSKFNALSLTAIVEYARTGKIT